ncbi:piggyBac transposable element-derived protein 4-like [Macrosteles quadrilineatus]|uniref:piggyBac transposable element-derived protein 4-like n=1 Tax=Macrosteles quadrilineatus TaxID=74068 RepID=UPI0023E2F393|nr:piggyBac transposable element-derived protein 4-like [Macrosteles quadrilineatus]XP_054277944.1 piggyBac transposable element-derived protein 4-like [Macrosteles quadrilineatus]
MKMHLTGTVNSNRQGNPSNVNKKRLKGLLKKHETAAYRHKDNVLVLVWRDQRHVIMMSSYHNSDMQLVKRREKGRKEDEIVSKPVVVCDYNERMGGVDTADHYISSYMFVRKSKVWWRKLWFWLMEVCVVNSLLLYNMDLQNKGKTPIDSKRFREMLITELVSGVRNKSYSQRGRPSSADQEDRLDKKPHFIYANEKSNSKDCAVCSNRKAGQRRETVYFCATCARKPGLHPGQCFERYHTLKNYKM